MPGGNRRADRNENVVRAGGLLQVQSIRANPDEAFAERQMLRHGHVDVEDLSTMVSRLRVLRVDVVADVGGKVEAVLLAEIANQQPWLEGSS